MTFIHFYVCLKCLNTFLGTQYIHWGDRKSPDFTEQTESAQTDLIRRSVNDTGCTITLK